MPNLKKLFAILAVMLCVCMAIPSTVYANELTPDSTPESTLSPDDSASGEISADPTTAPEVIAPPEAIATPEVITSAEPEATAEASAEPTAEPEATAATDIPAATTAAVRPARAPAAETSSVMMSGSAFNVAVKRLSGESISSYYYTNSTIKAFIVTADDPPEGATTIDLNTLSGGTPLLTWFDSSMGTVYCQAKATSVTLTGDCSVMFFEMRSLQKVDFGQVTVAPSSAVRMFYDCHNLTALDVSSWDTSQVTDMTYMFGNCSGLTTLDVSNWDTGNVTNMSGMFYDCNGLTTLDVSNWNTGRVTDMSRMFYAYFGSKFATLDVSNWDTSAVTDMSGMFYGCGDLATLDVSGWDAGNVTNMSQMFHGCSDLTTPDVQSWNTGKVTDMSEMFYHCNGLTTLDASNWDTSKVTNMGSMFEGCSRLTTIGTSNWDTGNVKTMRYMFRVCRSLTTLDVSNWDTGKVINMSGMFDTCDDLTVLDVSNWNTGNVTNMSQMFHDCESLATLDVSSWNTDSVTNMQTMFSGCGKLTALDLSGWNTSKVTNMSGMFLACPSLATLDVSGWNTSGVTNMSTMFQSCYKLNTLNLSSWDTSKVTNMSFMFIGSNNLASIKLGPGFVNGTKSSNVFPTPSKTISGRASTGTWGLGSETAEKKYTAVELTILGRTAGALTGTWYAQKVITSVIHFNADQDSAVAASGSMSDQTVTGTQNLNANRFSADGYKFYGWTTEKNSWLNGTHNGVLYADKASITATGSDITLHAYLVPADHDMTIRVLDPAGNPVPGVTVRYWQKSSSGYDDPNTAVKGEYTTGGDGIVSAGKYQAVYSAAYESSDASWNGSRPVSVGGYTYQIMSAPDGYKFRGVNETGCS